MRFLIEKTSSRTGLHKRTKRVYIVNNGGKVKEYVPTEKLPTRGTYVKGEAYLIEFPYLKDDELLVYLDLVLNFKKRVKGTIIVYDRTGNPKLTLKYNKLKIRRSSGNRSYFWAAKNVIDKLNIPVKRINLLAGKD